MEYDVGKIKKLNKMVMEDTPERVSSLLSEIQTKGVSPMPLVYAYRCRDLEMMKALIEGGVNFNFDSFFYLVLLNVETINGCYKTNYFKNIECRSSEEEREKMFDYLYENRNITGVDFSELLYYAYFAFNEKTIKKLKGLGVTFSQERISILTGKFGRKVPDEWGEYCRMLICLTDDEFLSVLRNVTAETGETLHFTSNIMTGKTERFADSETLRFLLGNFDRSKMNKTQIMKVIIRKDKPECLEIVEKYGWLKIPRKRDEMIDFASENHAVECTAWLLEFKNRTADLAAEQLKAEKKAEYELNADPNSVAELKKIWGFEKRDDGTLVITRYKGRSTEINVPEKIGKYIVSAIGDHAFSPNGSRLTSEQCELRRNIVKVTLPDSINVISGGAFEGCRSLIYMNIPDGVSELGDNAFRGCKSLISVNIPSRVTKIGANAFWGCSKLSEIVIPDSVREIGAAAFAGCSAVKSVKIPRGVTEISAEIFRSCSLLEEVELPDTIQKIGNLCFYLCKSLKKIIIPEGIAEIGQRVFEYCFALETVKIPASVKKIRNYTYRTASPLTIFNACPNVKAVVYKDSYAEKYCKRNDISYTYADS